MRIEVAREPAACLEAYAGVPIAFDVASVLDVADGPGELVLAERKLDAPYVKERGAG